MKINSAFAEILRDTKLRMLKMHFEAQVGHLGSNLSCIDALMTIYHHALNDEDQFILSKGHSAGALYSTLWSLGTISEETLSTFAQDGTSIPGHPSGSNIPGLLFPTGSLGHGLSLSAGLALSKKFKKVKRIYNRLNSLYYNDAKASKMTVLDYMKSLNN